MRFDVLEFWAAMILVVAYITAAVLRRGAGGDAVYRRGLLHLCIAFFLMEVAPALLSLINQERDVPKDPSALLAILGLIALVAAVLLYLSSLTKLCAWLLGDRAPPG
jgi:uncharacterized membrane protein HdeD (DUF308 family)